MNFFLGSTALLSLSKAMGAWAKTTKKMDKIIFSITERKPSIHRGYYTVARRYEFYFRVVKQYFTNERSE